MCYVCSMCNACGKVDRLREINLTCSVCGGYRDIDDSVCPHCGDRRPSLPKMPGVSHGGKESAGFPRREEPASVSRGKNSAPASVS